MINISCGTVALMVLCQFSDICGPMWSAKSENWQRTIRATVPQLDLHMFIKIYKSLMVKTIK